MKLQSRLMISTLPIVFLAIGITLGFSSYITSRELESQIQANARLISQSYSSQLDQELTQVQRISEDLASAVITSINIETTLIDTRKRYPEFPQIFYTNATGKVIDMARFNAANLAFDFSDTHHTKRAGIWLALVGPHFIRLQTASICAGVTGLSV